VEASALHLILALQPLWAPHYHSLLQSIYSRKRRFVAFVVLNLSVLILLSWLPGPQHRPILSLPPPPLNCHALPPLFTYVPSMTGVFSYNEPWHIVGTP
jgi:hypothetical protein